MSDDLVKQLRDWRRAMYNTGWVHLADSMEAVADRLAELEAKLAKAVEALGNVVGEYDLFRKDEYERGLSPLDDEIHDARTTLAELKGEDRG